jgi:DNA repair and recombination protein RAD52
MQHTKFVSREDVGFGTGIAKTLADAHENGAKESVTDSLKRCLKSFGNQYGLSLYDKSRQHQNKPQSQQIQQPTQKLQSQSQTHNSQHSYSPQEYASLFNLGLQILEQGNDIVVVGEDIFSKKDSIKACGFRWDGGRKLWYKTLHHQQAA